MNRKIDENTKGVYETSLPEVGSDYQQHPQDRRFYKTNIKFNDVKAMIYPSSFANSSNTSPSTTRGFSGLSGRDVNNISGESHGDVNPPCGESNENTSNPVNLLESLFQPFLKFVGHISLEAKSIEVRETPCETINDSKYFQRAAEVRETPSEATNDSDPSQIPSVDHFGRDYYE